MRFPFVSRSHLDDVVTAKDQRIADLEKRLADVEIERRRLIDVFAVNSFNLAIYDQSLTPKPAEEPEEKLTDEQKIEREREQERNAEVTQLNAIARTRPSQLGPMMSHMMATGAVRAVRAARPEVRAVFKKVSDEATTH